MRLLLFCTLFIFSCNKNLENSPTTSNGLSHTWRPIVKDYWVEYQVDTFTFTKSSLDTAPTIIHSISFMKEVVGDTILGFDSPVQYSLDYFFKKNLTDPYHFYRTHSLQYSINQYIENISNNRFVKLIFPINSTTTWKGNKYIDTSGGSIYTSWDYKYADIFHTQNFNGIFFDSTITVIHIADSNAIEKKYVVEIYAKNIGLIYSTYQLVEKQNGANPWTKPENGIIVHKVVKDWKK